MRKKIDSGNLSIFRKAGTLFVAMILLICVVIPTVYSTSEKIGDKDIIQNQSFSDGFTLTIIIEGNGCVYKDPYQTTYEYGTIVELYADPWDGWAFSHWGGDLSGSDNPEYITMDGNKTVIANFSWNEYTLDINIEGNGDVIKDPDQEIYEYETVVEVTAVPDEEWSFTHWSGDLSGSNNPEYITIDDNKTITAHFSLNEYSLTINIIGEGTVLKDPDLTEYPFGSTVELTAIPEENWFFEYWSGDLSGNENPEEILIDGDKQVNVHFKKDDTAPQIKITKPEKGLYIQDEKILPFIIPVIFDKVTIEANASDEDSGLDKVEFYVDGELKETDNEPPFLYQWNETIKGFHTVEAKAYDNMGHTESDSLKVFQLNPKHPFLMLALIIVLILLFHR